MIVYKLGCLKIFLLIFLALILYSLPIFFISCLFQFLLGLGFKDPEFFCFNYFMHCVMLGFQMLCDYFILFFFYLKSSPTMTLEFFTKVYIIVMFILQISSLLYVDQPIGIDFSYNYPCDIHYKEEVIGNDLYDFLQVCSPSPVWVNANFLL